MENSRRIGSVTEEDLLRFVNIQELPPEVHSEIVRQLEIVGSPVREWIEDFDQKMEDPFNVSWAGIVKGAEAASNPKQCENTDRKNCRARKKK